MDQEVMKMKVKIRLPKMNSKTTLISKMMMTMESQIISKMSKLLVWFNQVTKEHQLKDKYPAVINPTIKDNDCNKSFSSE